MRGRRSVIEEASSRGIPAAVLESGRSYVIQEESVQFFINGIKNVMKALKMIPGALDTPKELKEIPFQMRSELNGAEHSE